MSAHPRGTLRRSRCARPSPEQLQPAATAGQHAPGPIGLAADEQRQHEGPDVEDHPADDLQLLSGRRCSRYSVNGSPSAAPGDELRGTGQPGPDHDIDRDAGRPATARSESDRPGPCPPPASSAHLYARSVRIMAHRRASAGVSRSSTMAGPGSIPRRLSGPSSRCSAVSGGSPRSDSLAARAAVR